MHLEMTERQIGAVTVLDLAGKLSCYRSLTKTTGGLKLLQSFHQLPAGSPVALLAE